MISIQEEHRIKGIFFLMGLIMNMPCSSFVNASFIINKIYNENISVTILGCISTSMIISSFIQLTTNYMSFKLILCCIFVNVLNLAVLVLLINVFNASKCFIYAIASLNGLLIGFVYSASTKFSLLFSLNVNGYMTSGLSFCSLVVFCIQVFISFMTIEDSNIQTYYNLLTFSISTIAGVNLLFLFLILIMHIRCPFFLQELLRIESQREEDASSSTCGQFQDTSSSVKTNEVSIPIPKDSEILSPPPSIISTIEKPKELQNLHKEENGKEGEEEKDYLVKEENKVEKKESIEMVNIEERKLSKEHYFISDDEKENFNKVYKKKRKPYFNYKHILDGARLIKYYYMNLMTVTFTIFLTYNIYPHIIPNKMNKNIYLTYVFMLIYQLSDLAGNFSIIVFETLRKILRQKLVLMISFSRISLMILSYNIIYLKTDHFLYSNGVIATIAVLLGLTNGSLINLSYSRISSCFEYSEKKDKDIAAASSFSAVSFLSSFALAPWVCRLIIQD